MRTVPSFAKRESTRGRDLVLFEGGPHTDHIFIVGPAPLLFVAAVPLVPPAPIAESTRLRACAKYDDCAPLAARHLVKYVSK